MNNINKLDSTPLPGGPLCWFVPIPSAFAPCDLGPGEPVLPAMPASDRGAGKVESPLA